MAKELLTLENGIKLGGLIIAFVLQYAAIKSDIRDLKTEKHFEIEYLQYQVTELKDCCNGRKRDNQIVFNDHAAILPNGIEIETEEKFYKLEDLASQDVGESQYMEPLAVLSGFINKLGYPGIVNPSRETLENTSILPVNVENGYPLRRDTRVILDK